jgi:hypothetical protein
VTELEMTDVTAQSVVTGCNFRVFHYLPPFAPRPMLQLPVRRESQYPDDKNKKKLRGFSPQVNYTDRATAACQRS